MSNSNNVSVTKNYMLSDIISISLRYKFHFFIIFIILFFLGILLENFVPKKNRILFKLKEADFINMDIYPNESNIVSIPINEEIFSGTIKGLGSNGLGRTYKVNLDFVQMYLIHAIELPENLFNFSKLNYEQYNLHTFLKKKENYIKRKNNSYHLILPNNPEFKNFISEYLDYAASLAVQDFKKDALKVEQNKLDNLLNDIKTLNQIFEENINQFLKDGTKSELIFNLKITKVIFENKEKQLNSNIDFLKNMKSTFNRSWLRNDIKVEIKNKKFYKFSKFSLPIILSLIIYMIFILIKLTKLDQKN